MVMFQTLQWGNFSYVQKKPTGIVLWLPLAVIVYEKMEKVTIGTLLEHFGCGTKQPILKRDKIAYFQNETKQPILKSDKTVYFQNKTKQQILKRDKTAVFKTRQNSLFSKRDKTADFQNGTKQLIFKMEQNECCYCQYAWNLIYLKMFIFVVWLGRFAPFVPFAK